MPLALEGLLEYVQLKCNITCVRPAQSPYRHTHTSMFLHGRWVQRPSLVLTSTPLILLRLLLALHSVNLVLYLDANLTLTEVCHKGMLWGGETR